MSVKWNQLRGKKLIIGLGITLLLLTSFAAAYKSKHAATLSMQQLAVIVKQSNFDPRLSIEATPEVLKAINNIIDSTHSRKDMRESLERMTQYQKNIESLLEKNNIPAEFVAIPLMESHYKNMGKINTTAPAGLWQITPATAKMLGLTVNNKQDDRLNTTLASEAMAHYLTILYGKLQDWNLVLLAYNVGDSDVERLVKAGGSTDKWVITRSKQAPNQLGPFLAVFEADVILMRNPQLLR